MANFALSLVVGFCITTYPRLSSAQGQSGRPAQPIWAKNAAVLDLGCKQNPGGLQSPDHKYLVQVACDEHAGQDPTYRLRLVGTQRNASDELPLAEGAHDLVWAPDSRAFFVDGGETGYSGFFVDVYQIDDSGRVKKSSVTDAAQVDMVKSFPPCKAWNRDEEDCRRITRNPEYNMSGLAWSDNSAAINVFAEVPCSSFYGGIMCQVLGYELSVPAGRILKRLSAREVKEQWSRYAAWDIHIPEPPRYGPAHVTW
ncbi:MAG: hypothetical protein JOY95_05325 [Silvibacterium sp.]|nr:hypothetical protein [Silvibacterium sp.]